MTTNTIKTTANLIKAGLIGFVAAAGFGLIAAPAKADEVNQDNVQTNQQEGKFNTGVNQNEQNAAIQKRETRIGGHSTREGRSQSDKINQRSDQLNDQYGHDNTGVNQNTQNGRIQRDRTSIGR